jgi:ArsR family transcriptional regulator
MIPKDAFEMQARLCQAMGHAARLEIIHILRDGPQCINGLAQVMSLNQAILSRHMAILRQVGLVTAERQGQENVYHLTNLKIVAVCNLMREVLAEQIQHQTEVAKTLTEETL